MFLSRMVNGGIAGHAGYLDICDPLPEPAGSFPLCSRAELSADLSEDISSLRSDTDRTALARLRMILR